MPNRREFRVCAACGVPTDSLDGPCPACGYHPRKVTLRLKVSVTQPLERYRICQECGYGQAEVGGSCPRCGISPYRTDSPALPEPSMWPFAMLLFAAMAALATCSLAGVEMPWTN